MITDLFSYPCARDLKRLHCSAIGYLDMGDFYLAPVCDNRDLCDARLEEVHIGLEHARVPLDGFLVAEYPHELAPVRLDVGLVLFLDLLELLLQEGGLVVELLPLHVLALEVEGVDGVFRKVVFQIIQNGLVQ